METTQAPDPEWLTVGADVVLVTGKNGKSDGTGTLVRTTVKSLTKRDVVPDNGGRINRERLQRTNGTWDPTTFLYPADAPEVAWMSLANRKATVRNRIRLSLESVTGMLFNREFTRGEVRREGLLGDNPAEALDNIERYLNGALDQVAAYRRLLNETTEVETNE